MEGAGFTRAQAEVAVKVLVDVMENKLASKQDLLDLATVLKQDLKDHAAATKFDMQKLSSDMKDLEFRMTMRMGTMLVATIGILTAIQKLT